MPLQYSVSVLSGQTAVGEERNYQDSVFKQIEGKNEVSLKSPAFKWEEVEASKPLFVWHVPGALTYRVARLTTLSS